MLISIFEENIALALMSMEDHGRGQRRQRMLLLMMRIPM